MTTRGECAWLAGLVFLVTWIVVGFMVLLLAGCGSDGGPTGSRVTCRDYPVGAPVASTCE